MKSHEFNVTKTKSSVRPGRGISAGRGKTAGRGTKGQNSRSGGKRRPGFEGGQNPIFRRIPKKRGFRSYKSPAETVLTAQLETLSGKVTNHTLADAGMVSNPYVSAKVVASGELTKKLTVELQAASKSAIEMIEKASGSFNKVSRVQRPAKKGIDKE